MGSTDPSNHLAPEQAKYDGDDDTEEDFYDECYFATHPDDIDPKLSLGMIEWKAPLPNKRPLPATFAEAELEALAPRKPLPTDKESVSDYFIKARRHESLLSIRQTEYWEEMKDDIIFKEFPRICSKLLTLPEMIAKYRDRPDPTWKTRESSPIPEPGLNHHQNRDADGGAMDIDSSTLIYTESAVTDKESDMLGNLEQAIQHNGLRQNGKRSRTSSVTSISSQKIKRPIPLMPIRDQAQEDVLAKLGVTGSPKIVYQTPGPASAHQPQQNEAASRSSSHNSVASNGGSMKIPPPPPPPPGHPPYQNGGDRYRRGSSASQHTAAGSDFEDNNATPRPKYNSKDSRKRAHEDSSDDNAGRVRPVDNDETPKQRRKQPRFDPYT